MNAAQRTFARVLKGFDRRRREAASRPPTEVLVERARAEQQRILHAISASALPFVDVAVEVDALARELEQVVGGARMLADRLGEQHPVGALPRRIDVELARFDGELGHLASSLGSVHAQLTSLVAARELRLQEGLAAQVRELRDRLRAVAEGIRDAASRLDDAGPVRTPGAGR